MIENNFLIATLVSVVFLICKFIEIRFISKENKPIKNVIIDMIIIYFSIVAGIFVMQQLKLGASNISGGTSTQAFTNNPDF